MTTDHVLLMRVAFTLLASRWMSARRYAAICIICEALRRALLQVPNGARPGVCDAVLLALDALLFVAPSAALVLLLECTPRAVLASMALVLVCLSGCYMVGDERAAVLVALVLVVQTYCAAHAFTHHVDGSRDARQSRWACVALALVSISGAAFAFVGWVHVLTGNFVAYAALCGAYLLAKKQDTLRGKSIYLV